MADGSFKDPDMSNEQAEDLSKHLLQLQSEIEYFVNLVDEHELKDKNVLKYYRE